MITDIGEFIVGAYLQLKLDCDVVDYDVRPPGGGLKGLEELDVVGLNFKAHKAYLCEVTTHIRGLQYGDNAATVARVTQKHERQKWYGENYLHDFSCEYMLWSPVVPIGYITDRLVLLRELELVINGEYKRRVEELKVIAKETTHDARNPFFRVLQILEHMRNDRPARRPRKTERE
jgi:hypothetical protein